MGDVHWRSLLDALARVERVGADASGLLCFGNTPQGGIFIEGGRVCWVAAHGLQRRLRDLLRDYSSLSVEELERIYERCRASGKLLGQTLVAEGFLQPHELQSALRRHSAECLVDLCHRPASTSWASHVGRGYAPRFTFRAVDLLFDSVALFYPDLRANAQDELRTFTGPGQRGTAFVLDPQLDYPLPLAATADAGVEAITTLGRAVEAIPRASRELGNAPAFALSRTLSGDSLLLWWKNELLFAVACDDRASLARATAQHLVQA
jgi:hypothetical protein